MLISFSKVKKGKSFIHPKKFLKIFGKILNDESLASLLFNELKHRALGKIDFSNYATAIGIIMKGKPEEKLECNF